MILKIKSITDVITNSSTEVYTIYDDYGMSKIKKLVDLMLNMANIDATFDDIFDIKYLMDDYTLRDAFETLKNCISSIKMDENIKEFIEDFISNKIDRQSLNKIPYELKLEVAKLYDEEYYSERPAITGFKIEVKDKLPKNLDRDELNELINAIGDGMFFDTKTITE